MGLGFAFGGLEVLKVVAWFADLVLHNEIVGSWNLCLGKRTRWLVKDLFRRGVLMLIFRHLI